MSGTTTAILGLKKVRKHYGRFPALRSVDLSLHQGEFLAIVGPNGAGKSTLMNCIAMVLRPSGGTIQFRGENIYHRETEFRRSLGYISHFLFLYGELTGMENLEFYARLYGLRIGRPAIEESLERMGLFAFRHQAVRTYSRGMKQRLAIARALIHEPEIVLLDEPFTGLDQHASAILQDLLLALREAGKTVLMISHDLDRAVELADRVVVMIRGKIRESLSTREAQGMDFRAHYIELVARHGGKA